ncbi:hypothetical protein F4604DRAFT_1687759 [Suillus subluteus]|nr:hypothetical protein F4604DRAFT_1687759 [Suillus subluteus]
MAHRGDCAYVVYLNGNTAPIGDRASIVEHACQGYHGGPCVWSNASVYLPAHTAPMGDRTCNEYMAVNTAPIWDRAGERAYVEYLRVKRALIGDRAVKAGHHKRSLLNADTAQWDVHHKCGLRWEPYIHADTYHKHGPKSEAFSRRRLTTCIDPNGSHQSRQTHMTLYCVIFLRGISPHTYGPIGSRVVCREYGTPVLGYLSAGDAAPIGSRPICSEYDAHCRNTAPNGCRIYS